MIRPWDAPDAILSDAGVELGENYPYPVISVERSEAELARAAAVIEQFVVEAANGAVKARLCL